MNTRTPPFIDGSGEYGATRVTATKDGDMVRIAFGREAGPIAEVYYLGVFLSPGAAASLKRQLDELGI